VPPYFFSLPVVNVLDEQIDVGVFASFPSIFDGGSIVPLFPSAAPEFFLPRN